MSFKLNCRYYPRIIYVNDVDPYSKAKAADELTEKLRNLIAMYKKNIQYAQEL